MAKKKKQVKKKNKGNRPETAPVSRKKFDSLLKLAVSGKLKQ